MQVVRVSIFHIGSNTQNILNIQLNAACDLFPGLHHTNKGGGDQGEQQVPLPHPRLPVQQEGGLQGLHQQALQQGTHRPQELEGRLRQGRRALHHLRGPGGAQAAVGHAREGERDP